MSEYCRICGSRSFTPAEKNPNVCTECIGYIKPCYVCRRDVLDNGDTFFYFIRREQLPELKALDPNLEHKTPCELDLMDSDICETTHVRIDINLHEKCHDYSLFNKKGNLLEAIKSRRSAAAALGVAAQQTLMGDPLYNEDGSECEPDAEGSILRQMGFI